MNGRLYIYIYIYWSRLLSVRACVRSSVRPSSIPSVSFSIRPSVRPSVVPSSSLSLSSSSSSSSVRPSARGLAVESYKVSVVVRCVLSFRLHNKRKWRCDRCSPGHVVVGTRTPWDGKRLPSAGIAQNATRLPPAACPPEHNGRH